MLHSNLEAVGKTGLIYSDPEKKYRHTSTDTKRKKQVSFCCIAATEMFLFVFVHADIE